MIDELKSNSKLIGLKQSTRAIEEGQVSKAFAALDSAPEILKKLVILCENNGVEIEYVETMAQLGEVCEIDVGASIAVITKS
jgi:large subunit ribosomal protein L7A